MATETKKQIIKKLKEMNVQPTHLSSDTKMKCEHCGTTHPISEFDGEYITRWATHKACGHETTCPIFSMQIN